MSESISAGLSRAEQLVTLQAIDRALRHEAQTLSERPDLLWQQLYNRLWFEDGIDQQFLLTEYQRREKIPTPAWLRSCSPGFESARLLNTLVGYTEGVTCCAFSPDGERLASGGEDRAIRIWDVRSGRELMSARGHRDTPICCAYSPDGRFVASGAQDGLRLWDAQTGAEIRGVFAGRSGIRCCTFSRDGNLLASGDGGTDLWDVPTGTVIQHLDNPAAGACAYSLDGRTLVLASGSVFASNCTIALYDASSFEPRVAFEDSDAGYTYSCAFSPNNERLCTAGFNRLVIRDARSGKPLKWLIGHTHRTKGCAYSPDGKTVASASLDGTVRLWDAATGKELETILGHSDGVSCVDFRADGCLLVSGSGDGTLKLWRASFDDMPHDSRLHGGRVYSCSFSPHGDTIVTHTGNGGQVSLWDFRSSSAPASRRPLTRLEKSDRVVAVSPNGLIAGSRSADGIELWNTESGQHVTQLPFIPDEFVISPEGDYVLTYARGTRSTATLIRTLDQQKRVLDEGDDFQQVETCIVWPDSSMVARVAVFQNFLNNPITPEYSVSAWRFKGDTVETLGCDLLKRSPFTFAFQTSGVNVWIGVSPDATFFMTYDERQVIEVWDATTFKRRFTLRAGASVIAPDGREIVGVDKEHRLCAWEAESGKERQIANLPERYYGATSISPDGRLVALAGIGSTGVWNLQDGHELFCLPIGMWSSAAFHPWLPFLVLGGRWGQIELVELVGALYTEVIARPTDRGRGLIVDCPRCRHAFAVTLDQLGMSITCSSCALPLKLTETALTKQTLLIKRPIPHNSVTSQWRWLKPKER